MEKLMTKKELQEILKISQPTIDRWRREGMPSIKVGRGVRFNQETLDWINKNKSSEK